MVYYNDSKQHTAASTCSIVFIHKVQTSKRAENSETIKPMQILFHTKLLSDRYFQENFKTLKKHPLLIHNT
jgi:hypothetical protein